MGADRADCGLEQLVAGSMTVGVVDSLEADDVDVGDDEQARGPTGTIDLQVEVRQTGAAGARSGQHISLGECQLIEEGVSVFLGLRPVASRLLAIVGRLSAIFGGPGSSFGRRGPIGKGAPAVRCRALLGFRVRWRVLVGSPGSVAGRELVILQRGRFIAGHCRCVAIMRDGIAGTGNVGTPLGSLPSFQGVVIAKITRGVMHDAVSALSQVAIAGFLIGIGRVLVALGRSLVAVGPRLIRVRERLLAISKRLLVGRFRRRRDGLVF